MAGPDADTADSRTGQSEEEEPTMSAATITAEIPVDAAAEAPSAVVSATGLVRRYGEGETAVEALRGVSIDVAREQITAIMGPSGSGKSTLMNILAGLDRPTEGSVLVDGVDITGLNDKKLTLLRREKIGFVFQFFNLLPMLTAEENILLPLSLAGRKPDEVWLDELMHAVGIQERRKHKPAELSGGQQQRVAIARALVARPAVLFADEPTGNLDSASSNDVLNLLRRSADELGQMIVMVTHDPKAAARADRILFIADGRIVKDQTESQGAEVIAAMQEVTGR
jgi:putative ABC transport system ATP-binding protein